MFFKSFYLGSGVDASDLVRARQASAFLNIRVADIQQAYREWSARGAEFLTEPKDHGRDIRAFIRDPDGHLIEVGQTRLG